MKNFLFLLTPVIFFGCSGTIYTMNTDSHVPSAQGELITESEENGNTQVQLNVKHMARPKSVEPLAETYVVWAQDNRNTGHVQNLGALRVNENLEGELRALTAMKRFDVFVTAEPVANVQFPTGRKNLWTTVVEE